MLCIHYSLQNRLCQYFFVYFVNFFIDFYF
nr:MAG TPA: hypothetical protein [Caudoviricetes sp.]